MDEKVERLTWFGNMALQGAEAIRRHVQAFVNDDMYLRIAGYSVADPRAYLIYGVLDEVERSGMHLMRIVELLSDNTVDPRSDRVSRNVITHLVEELRARGRKLTELLLTLILFQNANEQEYYRHLLMLENLVGLLRENHDIKEYYGKRSQVFDHLISEQVNQIINIQNHIDMHRATYAAGGAAKLQASKLPTANGLLSSTKERMNYAIPHMTATEKISLSFTYGQGFGEASATIHYSAYRSPWKIQINDDYKEASRIGLLVIDILLRSRMLLDNPSLPIIDSLDQLHAQNLYPTTLVHWTTAKDLKIGDFVLLFGPTYLGEVLEVCESQFGYRCYRVLFLAERQFPHISEDWFPAYNVTKIYSREDLLQHLPETTSHMPDDLGPFVTELLTQKSTAPELQTVLRTVMTDLWTSSLRDFYHNGL